MPQEIDINRMTIAIPDANAGLSKEKLPKTNEEIWEQIEKEHAYTRKPIKRK